MYAVQMPSLGSYMHKFSTRILTTCLPAAGSVAMASKREIEVHTRRFFIPRAEI
jgi:hypothetical protein